MISPSFSTKLNDISSDLGMNPRDLLLVMYLESGVNPNAKNPHGGATGLIQFMPSTLKGMGLSDQEVKSFGQRSAENQLDFVKKYIQAHRGLIGGQPFTSATQYYIANFYPIALKKWNGSDPVRNANVVVVDSQSPNSSERAAYKENTILDTNKDGKITVGDITNILMKMEGTSSFQNMVKQFNTVAGNGTVSEKSPNKTFEPQTPSRSPMDNNMLASFVDKINSFLDSFASSQLQQGNLYLISISSDNDVSSKLEYARILSIALKEELDANSEIYSSNDNIQLECVLNADPDKGSLAIKELCSAVEDAFAYATKKIGSIKINTKIVHNVHSRYQKLDIKLADINYRKFHLKFSVGK